VDHILLAGDLTDTGAASELEAVAAALRGRDANLISVVPGNHDIARFYPFSNKENQRSVFKHAFSEFLTPGPNRLESDEYFPFVKTIKKGFVLVGLDSTILGRPIWALEGSLGEKQLRKISELLDSRAYSDSNLIFLIHHDPLARTGILPPHNVLADAARFKNLLFSALENKAARSICVIFGHTHEKKFECLRGVSFVCIPGFAFVKNKPCFTQIQINASGGLRGTF
ncbi:MAG TPA: metallophosphoesterase, partial [bacterium]|nr:metallophosphoesterase [bacterium]